MSKCAVHCPSGSSLVSLLAAVPVVLAVGGGLWVMAAVGAMVPVAVPFIVTPLAVVFVIRTVIKTTRADRARLDPQTEEPEHQPELVALPAPRKALPAAPSAPEVPVAIPAAGKTVTVTWRRYHP